MHRRQLLRAAGLAALVPAALPLRAQGFPSRPVTLLVPYAVGGNADFTARLLAEALSKSLGQPVVVDNKGGGGGSIGALQVIGARADGHTLLFSAPGVFSVTPHLIKVAYTADAIRPVSLVSKTPLVLVVRKGSKHKTLAELVQGAKAQPGAISMGYSGLGTPNHLALLNLESMTQARFNSVPYKGSGPMLQDMMAGQIEVAADQISTSKPFIDAGELVPLAVFGAPLSLLPGVPPVSTLGTEPFDATTYLGIAAPRGTPDAVIDQVQKAARVALQDARFVEGITKLGSSVHWGSAADYDRLMRGESDFVGKMVASGRIKPE
ncbi:MAG TPA: tripartite tricarboxylate transporter substrate binding protein [Ramlibacter sp.]|nr:tripartite tricarboxylate transporter substrate binding protein [Ramlibacter sp.]